MLHFSREVTKKRRQRQAADPYASVYQFIEKPIEFSDAQLLALHHFIPSAFEGFLNEFVALRAVGDAAKAVRKERVHVRVEEIEEFLLFVLVSHMRTSYVMVYE